MRESLQAFILQSGTTVSVNREFTADGKKVKQVFIATWNRPLTMGDLKELAAWAWPRADFLRDICVASDDSASLVLASKA